MENTQKTSFWSFINENKIEIPIIQRDYAQGRKCSKNIRTVFLKSLKSALDGEKLDADGELKLDFIYGSNSSYGKMNPLDGQQRLTTLWLLHWFIAKESGNLEENSDIFKKFSYSTRISSREFCEKLSVCKFENNGKIGKQITSKSWFYSIYKQDTTIQAMLNTLNSIEEIFNDKSKFSDYWNKLTGEKCPIVFFKLLLENFGLSDDLYIKMNARGKTLTSFENFKADLVDFLQNQKGKDYANEISLKLDTTWTDIFWKNRSKDFKIDEIYFAFFNRYFATLYILNNTNSKELTNDEDYKNFLDIEFCYENFDVYSDLLNIYDFSVFEKSFDNFSKSISEGKLELNIFNEFDNAKFIPEYDSENKVSLLESQYIPLFFAILKYFENGIYEEKSYKRWIRVIKNIIADIRLRNIGSVVAAVKKIDEIYLDSHNIYKKLSEIDVSTIPSKSVIDKQFIEECEKVKKIVAEPDFEQKIIEAEKSAFFNDQIRFLFKDENGNVDWSNFETKFNNSQIFFDKSGLKGDESKFEKSKIVCKFISLLNNQNQLMKSSIFESFFSFYDYCWILVLLSDDYLNPVHNLLMQDSVVINSDFETLFQTQDTATEIQKELVFNEKLVSKICNFDEKKRHPIIHWENCCVYPRDARADWKKIVLAHKRNKILSKLLKDEKISTNQKIDDIDYFWGWTVEFKYTSKTFFRTHTKTFLWTYDGKIICKKKIELDSTVNSAESLITLLDSF